MEEGYTGNRENLCDTCFDHYPSCLVSIIQFLGDLDPTVKGQGIDAIVSCDKYMRKD